MYRYILMLFLCFSLSFIYSCGSPDDNGVDGDADQNTTDGDLEQDIDTSDGDDVSDGDADLEIETDSDMDGDMDDEINDTEPALDGDLESIEQEDSDGDLDNVEDSDIPVDGDNEIEDQENENEVLQEEELDEEYIPEQEPELEPEAEEELEPESSMDCTCGVDEVNDDFEDGTLYGWRSSTYYEVIIDESTSAAGSNASLKLSKLSPGGSGVYRTFDAVTPCKISFYTYVETCPDSLTYQNFVTPMGSSNTLFKFGFTGNFGLFFMDNTDTFKKISDCTPNLWYHVEVYPDWENKTMDIYLDGNLVKDDFPFFRSATEYVDQFRFYHSANVSGNLDELEFFTDCNTFVDGDTDEEQPTYWTGDDFEDGNADGWYNAGTGYSVSVDDTTSALLSGHSMLLDQTESNPYGDNGPYYSFDQFQPCEVTFWVWADTCPSTNTQYQNYVLLKGKDIYQQTVDIFQFFITENGLSNYDGTSTTTLLACEDKTWYRVTYYLNWYDRKYYVYVNGQPKQSNVTFNNEAQFADQVKLYSLTVGSKARYDSFELKSTCN